MSGFHASESVARGSGSRRHGHEQVSMPAKPGQSAVDQSEQNSRKKTKRRRGRRGKSKSIGSSDPDSLSDASGSLRGRGDSTDLGNSSLCSPKGIDQSKHSFSSGFAYGSISEAR